MERKNLVIGLTAVSVIGMGGTLLWMGSDNKEDNNVSLNQNINPTQTPSSNTPTSASFKNGSYNAEGDYISPGGREKVFISLTLKDNVIENIEFESRATDPTSKTYQKIFADNFKQKVVGKKISEVKLDKVSGSSLTSNGFNQALQKIKDGAKES